jgi:hypothetical protein
MELASTYLSKQWALLKKIKFKIFLLFFRFSGSISPEQAMGSWEEEEEEWYVTFENRVNHSKKNTICRVRRPAPINGTNF